MENFQLKLEKYADLAVRIGINIQKNQTLILNAPIQSAEFTRMIVKKAYEAGAKNVYVEWEDSELSLIKYQNAPMEAFKEFPTWKADWFVELAKEGSGVLSIGAPNPDLLKSVDPEKIALMCKTSSMAMEEFSMYKRSCKISWSNICVPTKEWAKKIFPALSQEAAVEALWDKIFNVTRVDLDDPVKAWNEHINNLMRRLDYLNNKRYKKLHYKSSATDLSFDLPDEHIWVGGGMNNEKGTYFIPNLPTEEIFTMPLKGSVNGIVKSTMPIITRGQMIQNFSLKFEEGRIVDCAAEEGYEALKKLIETDEGSHYLGEAALVPCDSPISNSNIIFYDTLFDENASCHFALGAAYPLCIKDGSEMSRKEMDQKGVNTSLTHVDFMIGSMDLDIIAETAEGKLEPIFKQGNWAF